MRDELELDSPIEKVEEEPKFIIESIVSPYSQEIIEKALIAQMFITFSVPFLRSFINDIFQQRSRQLMIGIYFFTLILALTFHNKISNNFSKYIVFTFYAIGKLFTLWFLQYITFFEHIIILLGTSYFTIYCFLKLSHKQRDLNHLELHNYTSHILACSIVYTYIILAELPISYWYILMYVPFSFIYTMFVLLDLQLVYKRRFLTDNNDFITTAILIDADLFIPAQFIRYHFNLVQKYQEEQKKEEMADDDPDKLVFDDDNPKQ